MANTELLEQILKEVKDIRRIVDTFNNTKPVNTSNTTKEYKTYPKDNNLLNSLLNNTTNDKTKQFLLSIINNDYPTITDGQFKVIKKIQEDLGIQ